MLDASRAEDLHIGYDRIFAISPKAVGAGTEQTIRHGHVFCAAGHCIVSSIEPAIGDGDVCNLGQVDSVPTACSCVPIDIHTPAVIQPQIPVTSILDGQVADAEVAAVVDRHSMWAAHAFFAIGIEDVIAIDSAGALNRHIFDIFPTNQRLVPVVAVDHPVSPIHRLFAPCSGHGIICEVLAAEQRSARAKPQNYVAA